MMRIYGDDETKDVSCVKHHRNIKKTVRRSRDNLLYSFKYREQFVEILFSNVHTFPRRTASASTL